jgi:hypothetical protein
MIAMLRHPTASLWLFGKWMYARRRRFAVILAVFLLLIAGGIAYLNSVMFDMPGRVFHGPLPPPTQDESDIADDLRGDVETLAQKIGERNIWNNDKYLAAAQYIQEQLDAEDYTVTRQSFEAEGVVCHNIIAEVRGELHPEEIVIIGAHYDSVRYGPGADDNASGIAAMLAIARELSGRPTERTVRFVAFANEENPFESLGAMGSQRYAAQCRAKNEKIVVMIAFDGLGFYRTDPNSQHYPPPFNWKFPAVADFVGFVGNGGSADLLRRSVGVFRGAVQFPSQGLIAPQWLKDAGRSDHQPFWNAGFSAFLVTDTLPFRYPHYHRPTDTAEKIDYDRFSRVVEGLTAIAEDLGGVEK